MDDAFGGSFRQAAYGLPERAGCLFGVLGFNSALELLDKVLHAGLYRTVSKASLLGLAGGFKHIFVDNGHDVFLNKTEHVP
jgi:hypothetical protein